jgi:hypothetical protein
MSWAAENLSIQERASMVTEVLYGKSAEVAYRLQEMFVKAGNGNKGRVDG